MKSRFANIAVPALALLLTPISACRADEEKPKSDAHADHEHADADHHHHRVAGPNGGRLITAVEPHVEFLVTEDRAVRLTFVDEDNKAVAPAEQRVKLTGGSRRNPTRLKFVKDGDHLVSDAKLPEGNNLPIILQIRTEKGAKPVIEKFTLNLAKCPTCELAEYACICEHGDHEGHDHEGHAHEGHDHEGHDHEE